MKKWVLFLVMLGLLAGADEATESADDSNKAFSQEFPYMVVDLSKGNLLDNIGGGVIHKTVHFSTIGPDLTRDECRTTELWLRLIQPGTFKMGSPEDELGHRGDYEKLHEVTLTKPFYIGVFEITQTQWELLMGNNPSRFVGAMRPVECVSYAMLRGTDKGATWPNSNQVDKDSFIDVLRNKTSMLFDLPTEAQWEYACRAGSTTAFNSGRNLSQVESCKEMDEVGRYNFNTKDGVGGFDVYHTKVGSYLPNAWGLYDMHGNVWEWCLDWFEKSLEDATDPKGPVSGSPVWDGIHQKELPAQRTWRGGCWYNDADNCRSAARFSSDPNKSAFYNGGGVRVVCIPEDNKEEEEP